MSTVAPPPKPINPVLLESEHYIDRQIRSTRRALKLVDLAAGLLTLAIGLLGYVLVSAVLDQWVVPGGLGAFGRGALFGLLLLAACWYAWRQFIPLFRTINPVYAAQTIERSTPTLKNSLLNLLMFRRHRRDVSARVYHALEQQAAMRLSMASVDVAIDRTALLRLGYALALIVAICAAYSILSPKNFAASAVRVLAPWSDVAPPTRVQIIEIKPGETSIAKGERLAVSAEVHGLSADEAVQLRYSTADEQLVDESLPMKLPTAGGRRFEGHLPRGEAAVDGGVQQDLFYWIEAGDARSKKFKVSVFSRPTIVVQQVLYEYPAYTGLPTKEAPNTGDIRGLEGTRVTISALASQPIKTAFVDFDADGRNDMQMNVEGVHATASFELGLRKDRRTPTHASYILRFTTTENRTNVDPPKYRIDVTPDYAPEVRLTAPAEVDKTVKVDEIVQIGVEARDPDFAVQKVRLMGKIGGREVELATLLAKDHAGRFGAIHPFVAADAHLKPGEAVEYWAEARDNRRPDANIAFSDHHRLKIAAVQPPNNKQQQQQPGGQKNDQTQPGSKNQDGGNQGGSGGQDGTQSAGDAGGQDKGDQAKGQQAPGGAAGDGKQNDKSQGQQQGGGESGKSPDAKDQQPAGGGAGGESKNDQQPPQAQQQPGNNANSGGANSAQPQNGDKKPGQPQAQPGQPNNGEQQGGSPEASQQKGQPPENQPQNGEGEKGEGRNGEGQKGQPQNGDQQGGGQQSKVSAAGDDDGTAIQRMAEHFEKKQEQNGTGKQAQAEGQQPPSQENGKQQSEQATGAKQGAQGAAGQDASKGQQEGADPKDAKPSGGEQGKPGTTLQSPPDKSTDAAGQGQKSAQQKSTPAGAQSKGPRESATPADQQSAAAGQNPDKRQGADTPRETKNGDANPDQPKSAQQPSPDGQSNPSPANAGSGHNTDKQDGPPGSDGLPKRGKEKHDSENQKEMNDQEPPAGSPDNRESDSKGGQSGDATGGGKEGAGQKSDAPGKGTPGQHEAADEGGGRAEEQGKGETGSDAGSDQVAEGKTGQSSQNKKGDGSQQGDADSKGDKAGGKESSQGAGSKSTAGPQDGKPGDEKPGAKDSAQPQPGESGASSQEPADGKQSPQESGKQGGSAAAQPQGGQGGMASPSAQVPTEQQAQEDKANLDFARKQTDLLLENLDSQLAKKQVDRDLLKSLGWSEAELQQFVNRWKDLKARAATDAKDGKTAQELDAALRSLGLRQQGPTRMRASAKADKYRDLNEGIRNRAPLEYAERVRMYLKDAATDDKKADDKK